MKYTIHGFNQMRAVELGLSCDDLIILRWFIDFRDAGKMKRNFALEDNKFYYWVTYKKIIEDIPIIVWDCKVKDDGKEYKKSNEQRLYDCQRQRVKRIFQGNLSKILTRHVYKNHGGTFMYVSLNEDTYAYLIGEDCDKDGESHGVSQGEQLMDCDNDNSTEISKGASRENGRSKITKGVGENKAPGCSFNYQGRSNINKGLGQNNQEGLVNFDQTKINLLNNKSITNNNDIYSGVVDYLNKKTHSNYKSNTRKTQSLILARLNEGFTEEDFVKVIDNKCKDWLGTDYEQYLRPETLFGTKFESYLNQRVRKGNTYGSIKQNFGAGEISAFDFSRINDI